MRRDPIGIWFDVARQDGEVIATLSPRTMQLLQAHLAAISHNGVQFKVTDVREASRRKRVAASQPTPSPLVAGGAGSAMFPL
jgi:hypothetical protein